ncbi:hypothetical protein [Rhodanobacter sp. L36]|uniref:hypothetical protein n=1 Tax=Rhodanobacter sp. L36 TaxID=1747221 RepID=UPI00131AD2C6|nr:hypothetical protein [Rhodanobacter sp. L36]
MRRNLIAIVLAWLAWTPLHAATNCLLAAPLATVAQAQAHLQAQPVEDMDTDVPPAVRTDIRMLKDALTAWIDARLACADSAKPDVASMQTELTASLKNLQPKPDASAPYGSDIIVSVQQPENAPQWLLVQLGFSIECGDDNLLLVYASRDGAWRPAMRWRSGEYDKISGAFGAGFKTLVLSGATPRLVVFHGTPWCTSRWSGFDLDVLASGAKVDSPHSLFHQQHGYVIGDAEPALKPKADGFELRAEVGMRDMDVMTRTGIFRYRIDGNTVTRVQPVALNGRDFVDEWLQVEWHEAKEWSDPSALHELGRMHAELAADYGAKNNSKSFTFGAVRSCTDDRNVYQVQLDLAPLESQGDSESRYFRIRSDTNSFSMLSISPTPSPSCRGGDLMKKA